MMPSNRLKHALLSWYWVLKVSPQHGNDGENWEGDGEESSWSYSKDLVQEIKVWFALHQATVWIHDENPSKDDTPAVADGDVGLTDMEELTTNKSAGSWRVAVTRTPTP